MVTTSSVCMYAFYSVNISLGTRMKNMFLTGSLIYTMHILFSKKY